MTWWDKFYQPGEAFLNDWEGYALSFVQALLRRDFEGAHRMLSASMKAQWSAQALEQQFDQTAQCKHAPLGPGYVFSSCSGWPDQGSQELGQSYIQIDGDYNEAITPTVGKAREGYEITHIEWGRP